MTDHLRSAATHPALRDSLSDRQRAVGAMSNGYAHNDERREAAAAVERTEAGDRLREVAEHLDRTSPSASATMRLRGAYADAAAHHDTQEA